MTRPTDNDVIGSAVEALERMAGARDADSDQALNAARLRALEAIARRNLFSWRWAMAAAASLALALALAISFRGGNGEQETLFAQQPVAEADLYQEMEFYLWLSEQLESE